MKGLYIESYIKSAQDLKISYNLPIPDPFGDEVLVNVKAVGIGYPDYLHAQGKHQLRAGFPLIIGLEIAGAVVKAPSNSKFKPGDRVFGLGTQGLADYTVIPEQALRLIPSNLSFEQGAAIPLNYPTNYIGLFNRGELKKGNWCLIHGGTGGLGLSAIQLCKLMGVKVIATGTKDEKLKIATSVGADHVINILQDAWWDRVNEITGGKGVDTVYDPIGQVENSLNCIKSEGIIVIVGFAAGKIEKVPMAKVQLKNASLVGMTIGEYVMDDHPFFLLCYSDLFKWIASGELIPQLHNEKLYLKDIQKAFELIISRKSSLKIVITVND